MVKTLHLATLGLPDGLGDELVKLQHQLDEAEACKRLAGITPELGLVAEVIREEEERKRFRLAVGDGAVLGDAIGVPLPTIDTLLGKSVAAAYEEFEAEEERKRLDPMYQIRSLPELPFHDFQADDRRERDRQYDIETARQAKTAELEVEAEFRARQQQPAPARAAQNAPEPVVNCAPPDESIDDRNLRWLNHYETEERTVKRGAYNRTAAHFKEKPPTLRKAVDKAREKRAARNRAGIKQVPRKGPGNVFSSLVTTVIDGKKVPKNQR